MSIAAEPPVADTAPLRPEPIVWAALGAVAIGFWFAYGDSLAWMVWGWERNPYYSHGWLVPVISAWLLWRARAALTTAAWRTWWPGLGLVALGALMFLAGRNQDVNVVIAASFVVMLHGLVATVGGPQVYRLTWFPLFFLFFGVPVSQLWLGDKSFPLQQASGKLAATLMFVLTGAKTEAHGATMVLDGQDYVVGVACSGFKAIMGLTMIGFIVAYLTETTRLRKLFILLCTLPIAVASNVIRLFLILCVGRIWGHDFAIGFFHDQISGPIMLIVAIAVLILCARTIVGPGAEVAAAPAPRGDGTPRFRLAWQPAGLVAVCLFGVAAAGKAVAPPPADVPDVDLKIIPMQFGEWVCKEEGEIAPEVFEELGDVAIISRSYTNATLETSCYIHVICGRGRRSLHPPRACIQGGGNQILESCTVTLNLDGQELPFEHLVVGLDGSPVRVAMYTFTDGQVTTTDYVKYFSSSVTDRRRIWTQVHMGVEWAGSEEETTRQAEEFIREAWPSIVETLKGIVPEA